ncbi:hypothetical protein HMPREF6745_3094 [Prevotella sp. oral taxon 472 str. F0295]|nr:hypothetical protein HMPREF6745_3094 [Prevotella sp. oral taxon 472 str. F0295]
MFLGFDRQLIALDNHGCWGSVAEHVFSKWRKVMGWLLLNVMWQLVKFCVQEIQTLMFQKLMKYV